MDHDLIPPASAEATPSIDAPLNADLHCHSAVSDGTMQPEALAARAKANGVQLWALTDHDEIGGQHRARDAAAAIGLPYLTGTEISVTFADVTVHIVGLGFDPDDITLRNGLSATRGGRRERAMEMSDGLAKVGIHGAYDGALTYVGNPELISRTHFARFLVESKVCADTQEVFRKYLVEGKPGFVPHRWATLRNAVHWIVDAGGLAVIAHPARYKFSANAEYALFSEFKTHGGRACEVVTGSHSSADALRYTETALEFGLLASRGSDFHSPDESHTDLGRLPPLSPRLTPVVDGAFRARAPARVTGGPTAQRPALGVFLIIAMAAVFAVGDTTVKRMGGLLPVLLLLWSRYAFQAVAMALWLGRPGGAGFACAHPKFQWTRGLLLLATSGMSFFGLQRMPVAEFTALGMLTPVVVTLLAALVLHEQVSRMRWVLVIGGFVGALIVIRPGSGVFGWAAVFPLAMALCYGGFQVLTSRLASLESPYTTHFYTGFSGAVIVTPFMLFYSGEMLTALRTAPLWMLWPVLLIGLCATAGHLLLIFAFGVAPMAILMPFIYVQIGWALVASYVVFAHLPDGWAWFGIGVIALCGAFSAWLNVRRGSSTHLPDSVVSADTIAD